MLQTVPPNYHFPLKVNKKETLLGQKIKDCLNKIETSILSGNTDDAIFYCFDIILTGNYEPVIQKLCEIYITYINVNNFAFFEILFDEYYKIITDKKDLKMDMIKLINNQQFRNHICYMVTMLSNTPKSSVSFDPNYLKNNSKNLIVLEPITKLMAIHDILAKDTISHEKETTLYNYIVSLSTQHDDKFYKSCSIKTFTIDYLEIVWDIILRNSKSSKLKDIRKFILIGFNLYTKCFKDVRILLFVITLLIHGINQTKITTNVKNLIKYQLTINEFIITKFKTRSNQ